MSEVTGSPRRRDRSPSYPSIPLGLAVERARVIYEHERRHAAPILSLYSAWGFKGPTGPAAVTLAALKKYGLLEDEGAGAARKAKLTELALDILVAPSEDDPSRLEALRRAALSPTIFAAVHDRFGADLPSDETLRFYLVRERKFLEKAAIEVIRNYRETMQFAKVDQSGTVTAERQPQQDEGALPAVQVGMPPVVGAPAGAVPGFAPKSERCVYLPIASGQWATLEAPFPITEAAWDQMVRILEVMKTGLVEDGDGPPGGGGDSS